jgi:UDP-4-amino-4,6-dideoxy-N-acetyl-beta-L-altrosamine transaminase
MSEYIPYARQNINQADIDEVIRVLKGDFLTQGPEIEAFERDLARYVGATYAVAVSNATAALHIACLAAKVGPGDLVWTAANTFVASSNCALYCGAEVDFVDIDLKTYNMSVQALEEKLHVAIRSGRLPKVIIPVHFSGMSCEMKQIRELTRKHGILLIEDASHAIGGSYNGQHIGNCAHSEMAVFSFHPAKIVTTGEGGAVVTNDHELYKKLMRLRTHGITRDTQQMRGVADGPWYYQQLDLGFNYRITDLQAALGRNQLKRVDEFVGRRRELRDRYNHLLERLPVSLPYEEPFTISSVHLYVPLMRVEEISITHRQAFESMRTQNIGVNLHYIPVYLQPYYQDLGFKKGHCPNAEAYYERAISLPLFPDLTFEQQDRVVAALEQALPRA